MRLANALNRFRHSLRRQPRRPRPEGSRGPPGLEQLEDRLVPSTLNIDAFGNASYVSSTGPADNLTLSERLVILPGPSPSPQGAQPPVKFLLEDVLTDTAQKITVTGPGASGAAGSGTNQVTILHLNSLFVNEVNGSDVVNVQAINYATDVRHAGPGVNTVNVGDAGSLQGIQASLGLDDGGGTSSTQLNVDDSKDTANKTGVQLLDGLILNLAPAAINYEQHGSVGLGNFAVTITGGSGNDTYTVDSPASPTTLNSGGGHNQVNVRDTTAPLTILGHGGTDTVTVGSLAPALGGTVANIHGAVSVGNTTNSTRLIVDDSGDAAFRSVTIGANSVQFSGSAPVNFLAGVQSVSVFGGKGGDVFDLVAPYGTTPVAVHGGTGVNTLVSGAGVNDWVILGTNTGVLHNVFFQNVQNLQGGLLSLADNFHFTNGAGVTGTIRGGAGPGSVATLDYSQYTTSVTVDLKLNLALAGGFKTTVLGVRNVLGGSGNNILVGDGNNFLRGGSGRDILISGGGNSTLQAGSGEAILLGAHYLFDTSLAALDALMAEWSHTYDPVNPLHDYQIRVAHLENGGGFNGAFVLNKTTVVPQPGSATLTSGAGLDFLVLDKGDVLTHPVRPGEAILFV